MHTKATPWTGAFTHACHFIGTYSISRVCSKHKPIGLQSYKTMELLNPLSASWIERLQIHSDCHGIRMHQKHWWQTLTKNFQIANILHTLTLTVTRTLHRAGKRREYYRRIVRLLTNKFVDYEVLSSTGEVVERKRYGLLGWKARSWRVRTRCRCRERRVRWYWSVGSGCVGQWGWRGSSRRLCGIDRVLADCGLSLCQHWQWRIFKHNGRTKSVLGSDGCARCRIRRKS
jgi:hypothetical protein